MDVLQFLGAHSGFLVVSLDPLLREDLQKGNEPQSVAEVDRQIVNDHALVAQVLVAPAREGLLLNELPLRVSHGVAGTQTLSDRRVS